MGLSDLPVHGHLFLAVCDHPPGWQPSQFVFASRFIQCCLASVPPGGSGCPASRSHWRPGSASVLGRRASTHCSPKRRLWWLPRGVARLVARTGRGMSLLTCLPAYLSRVQWPQPTSARHYPAASSRVAVHRCIQHARCRRRVAFGSLLVALDLHTHASPLSACYSPPSIHYPPRPPRSWSVPLRVHHSAISGQGIRGARRGPTRQAGKAFSLPRNSPLEWSVELTRF